MPHETNRQKLIRSLLLVVLFAAVACGFWLNNDRMLTRLYHTEQRADTTGVLTAEQEQALREYSRRFKERYGVGCVVRIQSAPFSDQQAEILARASAPGAAPDTFFLGLCPTQGQVKLLFPPLLEKAVGTPFVHTLQHTHFIPYFQEGTWPEGLASALSQLAQILDADLKNP